MNSNVLYYKPSPKLPNVKVGDTVVMMGRNMDPIAVLKIIRIRPRYVMTDCGRKWTRDYGEWIAQFHGNKPEPYPFPSIQVAVPEEPKP